MSCRTAGGHVSYVFIGCFFHCCCDFGCHFKSFLFSSFLLFSFYPFLFLLFAVYIERILSGLPIFVGVAYHAVVRGVAYVVAHAVVYVVAHAVVHTVAYAVASLLRMLLCMLLRMLLRMLLSVLYFRSLLD